MGIRITYSDILEPSGKEVGGTADFYTEEEKNDFATSTWDDKPKPNFKILSEEQVTLPMEAALAWLRENVDGHAYWSKYGGLNARKEFGPEESHWSARFVSITSKGDGLAISTCGTTLM